MGGVISCFNPEYEKLKKYLDDGGDPNARTNENSQLFLYRNDVRCFELLLQRGADPNQPFHVTFPSPLVVSLGWNIQDRAMLLIQYGANVHWKDPYGHSVIHYVDASRQRKIFETLLERGVDINSKDHLGVTIFDRRLYGYGHDLKTLVYLARRGARMSYSWVLRDKKYQILKKIWARRKWLVVRCAVKFLGLHQRAVVSANHPLRKLERGEFKEEPQ
jgi:hypothetical protein